MRQEIEYLKASPMEDSGKGIEVSFEIADIEVEDQLPQGTGNVQFLVSAVCSSDVGPNGYYNARLPIDLRNPKKQRYVGERLMQIGYQVPSEQLGHSMHHEGIGILTDFTPHGESKVELVDVFDPVIEGGQIKGLEHGIIPEDRNDFREGDVVVLDAADRCVVHRTHGSSAFIEQCNRSTDDGHQPKMVIGHNEHAGTSISSEEGLPYPLTMMTPIRGSFLDYIQLRGESGLMLASQAEPLGCCAQGFEPLLMAGEKPEVTVLVGDGMNSAITAAYITELLAPGSEVIVLGCTPEKLKQIEAISPDHIHGVQVPRSKGYEDGFDEGVSSELKRRLGDHKVDLFVPTVVLEDKEIQSFDPYMNPDRGRVILWAANQHNSEAFKDLGNSNTPPWVSYGGIANGQLIATRWFGALAKYKPRVLDALQAYIDMMYFIPLRDAAKSVQQLTNTGRYADGTGYSGKIYIPHKSLNVDVFKRAA